MVKALLEALIAINVDYLRKNPQTPRLYQSGVRYDRTFWWEPIPAMYARSFGDCKSLTAARVAELRLAGIPAQPTFRFFTHPDGSRDFHILVMLPGGQWEDPSKQLGMRVE